ncbi:MAG: low molecular weight phosphotyrosine protein phosphatase [Chlamydiae bacterium]|nr:low molecular weight phosphotyrosine protein phosphatase [Chlamydiota bacterium]
MKSILFVCAANICRSPTLAATFHHLVTQKGQSNKFRIDSCGIGWFHVGERPDPRAFEAAKKKGILIDHRAQQFREEFFETFDLILTVEPVITEQLELRTKKQEHQQKIRLVTDFSSKFKGQPILDPYYMNEGGFDEMMEMILDACKGLLETLINRQ